MSPVPEGEDNRDKPPDNPDDNELNHQDPLDVVVNADSTDSEEENGFGDYAGYQMLAQDVNDNESQDENEDEDSDENASGNAEPNNGAVDQDAVPHITHPDFPNTSNLPGYMKVPDMPRPDKRDLLWNQPSRHHTLAMDPGHADKIRSAMAGFQLPTSHIPHWATSMTEDQWQEQVVDRLVDKTPCDKDTQESDNFSSSLKEEAVAIGGIESEAGTLFSEDKHFEKALKEESNINDMNTEESYSKS